MKTIHLLILIFGVLLFSKSNAQEINWKAVNDSTTHFIAVNLGADYSINYGLSYGYHIPKSSLPIVIGTELNLPFGAATFDDWKSRTSIQAQLWHTECFLLSLKGGFIIRRFESEIARLYNLGADATVMFGYVKPKWGICITANYDRTIATHIKNGILKEYYPEIKDGWYGTTGGNFKLGLRANRSFNSWNTYLTIGKMYGQDFKDNPTLPFFADIAIQKRF